MTPDQVVHGREAIRASLLTRPKSLITRHLATNVMVKVESRDKASGISYLTMIATTPGAEAKPPFHSNGPIYFGEFKDRFIREHGVWKFEERLGSILMKFGGAEPPALEGPAAGRLLAIEHDRELAFALRGSDLDHARQSLAVLGQRHFVLECHPGAVHRCRRNQRGPVPSG